MVWYLAAHVLNGHVNVTINAQLVEVNLALVRADQYMPTGGD